MSLDFKKIWVPLLVVTLSAFFMGVYSYKVESLKNPFKDKHLLEKGMTNPTIWIYYNDSEVNSRFWSDFGARSSRVLNIPFLNLCYQSIVTANKDKYKIEIISGLTDLASRLGGWQELPTSLQNPLASVEEAELNWIRAEVLAKFGGLWVHPATVCLKPFPDIALDTAVFFGTDPDETYADSNGTSVPGKYVMGAGRPGLKVFDKMAETAFNRLERPEGGKQIRGDFKWDFLYAKSNDTTRSIIILPSVELSRKRGGKRIQLEDLLGVDSDVVITDNTIYVPIQWPELRDRRVFGWFLRMSEEQIFEEDFVLAKIFKQIQ